MVALSVVRKVTIETSAPGAQATAGQLRDVATAQDGVSKSSLSMKTRLDALQRSLDADFRAEQQLARAEKDLAAARNQGLISLARQNELLGLAATKYKATGEAAEGMAEGMAVAKEVALGLIAALGAAAAFTAFAELPEKIKSVVEQAAGLSNVAQVIGVTTKELQELQYAGQLNDISTEGMNSALEKFSKNLGGAADKSSTLGKTFRANHVALSGDLMTDLKSYANLIEHAGSAAERTKLVTDAFGKGAANMGLLAEHGAAGIKEFADQADRAGAVIDGKMLVVAKELDDQFKTLQIHSETAFKQFAISVAPALLTVLKDIGGAADFLGSHFDVIARTAAVAGAAIIGYFGPAMVAGITDVAIALSVGMVNAIRAVTAAMLANPLGLLIAGIAAAVTAAYLFRDQIKQAIGVDFVAIIEQSVNWTIGAFVGAFNGIKDTWSDLPAALGDLAITTTNNILKAMSDMLNQAKGEIAKFMIDAGTAMGPLFGATMMSAGGAFGSSGKIDFGQLDNPYKGTADKVGKTFSKDMSDAQATDYVGKLKEIVTTATAATSGIDKLTGSLDDNGDATKLASDSADKLKKSYDELLLSMQQKIADSVLERQSIGLTADAALKLKNEQDLLQDAQKKGIDLDSMSADGSRTKREELTAYADKLTATTIETKKLQDAQEAAQQVWKTLGDTIGEVFSGGIKSFDEFVDHLLTGFAKIGQDNLGKLFSPDGFNQLFGNVTGGGTTAANDNGPFAGATAGGSFSKVLEGAVKDGTKAGWLDGLKNIPGGATGALSAGLGGLGIGYQAANPATGALGGALSGAAAGIAGGPAGMALGAVIGGLGGFIGGLLGANEALEKSKKELADNKDAIDAFIGTGLGDKVSQYTSALAEFNAQGAKLIDLAKAAGDSALVGKLQAAMDAYKGTLGDQFLDDLKRSLNDLNDKGYLNDFNDALDKYNQRLADAALLGVSAAGASEELSLSLKKAAIDAKLTTSQILVLAAQFPALAAGLNALIGVVGGKSLDDLQQDVDDAKSALRDAYNDQVQIYTKTADSARQAAKSIRDFIASLDTNKSLSPLSPYDQLQSAAAQFAQVSQGALAGNADDVAKLTDVSQSYLDAAKGYYASSEQYFAVFNQVKSILDQTANTQDSVATTADMQLAALNTQVGSLISIDNGVQSVAAAIAALAAAQGALAAGQAANTNGATPMGAVDQLYQSVLGRTADASGAAYWQGQISAAGGLNSDITKRFIAGAIGNGETVDPTIKAAYGYANGTAFHPGGMAWVGERGPELLNLPRGSQVYPNAASMRMAGAGNDNGALLARIDRLEAALVQAIGGGAAVVAGKVHENTAAVKDQTGEQKRLKRTGTNG